MTPTLPFQLIRSETLAPCSALLVPGPAIHGVRLALDCLASAKDVKAGAPPRVFATQAGLLITHASGFAAPPIKAIRLAELGTRIFIPCSAELLPALLPDEARALTGERGLLFLPGEAPLFFSPSCEISLSDLCEPIPTQRHEWQALPPEPDSIHRDSPESFAFEPKESRLSEAFGGIDDIGVDPMRPDGKDIYGARKKRIKRKKRDGEGGDGEGPSFPPQWLKRLLGKGAGGDKRGLRTRSKDPKFSERDAKLIAAMQEQALRDLLQDFREGRLDAALRRSIPIGSLPGPMRESFSPSTELGEIDTSAALANILRYDGQRSLWLGGAELQIELAQEYRKAANDSLEAGDHRRAAFILAKLLGDFRKSADAFLQGGYHAEAAEIYLTMLNDQRAAARAWQQAGEFERAANLYLAADDPLAAGECLRQAGLDAQADRVIETRVQTLIARDEKVEAAILSWRELGDSARAEKLLRECIAQGQNRTRAHRTLAELYRERNDPQALLAHARELRVELGAAKKQSTLLDALIDSEAHALKQESFEADIKADLHELTRSALLDRARHLLKLGQSLDELLAPLRHWESAELRDFEEAVIAERKSLRERKEAGRDATPDEQASDVLDLGLGTSLRMVADSFGSTIFCMNDEGRYALVSLNRFEVFARGELERIPDDVLTFAHSKRLLFHFRTAQRSTLETMEIAADGSLRQVAISHLPPQVWVGTSAHPSEPLATWDGATLRIYASPLLEAHRESAFAPQESPRFFWAIMTRQDEGGQDAVSVAMYDDRLVVKEKSRNRPVELELAHGQVRKEATLCTPAFMDGPSRSQWTRAVGEFGILEAWGESGGFLALVKDDRVQFQHRFNGVDVQPIAACLHTKRHAYFLTPDTIQHWQLRARDMECRAKIAHAVSDPMLFTVRHTHRHHFFVFSKSGTVHAFPYQP